MSVDTGASRLELALSLERVASVRMAVGLDREELGAGLGAWLSFVVQVFGARVVGRRFSLGDIAVLDSNAHEAILAWLLILHTVLALLGANLGHSSLSSGQLSLLDPFALELAFSLLASFLSPYLLAVSLVVLALAFLVLHLDDAALGVG